MYAYMAIASGPAGPVLAGPVSVFAFKTAHAKMIKFMDAACAARVTINISLQK